MPPSGQGVAGVNGLGLGLDLEGKGWCHGGEVGWGGEEKRREEEEEAGPVVAAELSHAARHDSLKDRAKPHGTTP